jgi:hypothetical protein
MARIIFFVSAIFFCTNALAVGDPAVVLSFLGEVLALAFPVVYILTAKTQWKRKTNALISILLGAAGIFIVANIPGYEKNAGCLDAASFIAVVISILLALFLLRPRHASMLKEQDSAKGQEY